MQILLASAKIMNDKVSVHPLPYRMERHIVLNPNVMMAAWEASATQEREARIRGESYPGN